MRTLVELAGVALCYLLALGTIAGAVALAVMVGIEQEKEKREHGHS